MKKKTKKKTTKKDKLLRGYIPSVIDKNVHWILGASALPQIVRRPDGQWVDYLPEGEQQNKNGLETDNCTGFNTDNPVEILLDEVYGIKVNISDRGTGLLAGTRPPGNDPQVVAEALRTKGFVMEPSLPFSDDIKTIEQYYSPDPFTQPLSDEAKKNLDTYLIGHEWVVTGDEPDWQARMKQALTYSPLGAAVYAWVSKNGIYIRQGEDVHWTTIVGYVEGKYWICMDSYVPFEKHLDWNFGFSQVKRYHVEKKNSSDQSVKEKYNATGFWGKILQLIMFFLGIR